MADHSCVPWHVKGQPLSRSTDAAAERRFTPGFVSLPALRRNLFTEECGAARKRTGCVCTLDAPPHIVRGALRPAVVCH